MSVYRRKLNPEVAAFAATKYHGHRHVPKTVDQLADELAAAGQKADSKKLMKLIVKQERGPDVMIKDPTKMDPSIFVGKQISKDFEGLGTFEGRVVSVDTDMLGNKLFRIVYLDGDVEDLFLRE